MIQVTKHAYERGKERLGLNAKAFTRLAEKAYSGGKEHKDVKGRLMKYLNYEFLKHKKANNMRIYGEFLYFFQGRRLLTVVRLDNKFKRLLRNLDSN